MKYLFILLITVIFCSGCSSTTYHNPYEINESNFEVKNINGKDVLFLKQTSYTDIITRQSVNREIVKRNIYDLNADTIQYAINGPLHNKCWASIYRPYYVNTTNMFFVDSIYCEKVNSTYIKQLYSAIKNNNSYTAKSIAYKIFSEANSSNSNYILYGKDSKGRNVGYIYQIGKENTGIVFYYPNNFSNIIKNIWKGPFDLGWNTVIEEFISTMKNYNPHLKIIKKHSKYDTYYIIKYK